MHYSIRLHFLRWNIAISTLIETWFNRIIIKLLILDLKWASVCYRHFSGTHYRCDIMTGFYLRILVVKLPGLAIVDVGAGFWLSFFSLLEFHVRVEVEGWLDGSVWDVVRISHTDYILSDLTLLCLKIYLNIINAIEIILKVLRLEILKHDYN